jgi:cystathionine beta-lyase/cystathionine gamma-synthase
MQDMEAETLRRESVSRQAPQPTRDAVHEDSRSVHDPNRAIGLPSGRSAMAAAAKLLG